MSTPYLILTDYEGNAYNFPTSFFLADDPLSTRSTIKELLFGNGGRQVGDRFANSRKIVVEGELHADSAAAFETALRSMMAACFKGGYLTIFSDSVARRIEVEAPQLDSSWLHWPNYKRVVVTFDAPFPFWTDSSETTSTNVMAGNGSFTVDLSGSDHIVMPVIEVEADQGVAIPSVVLTNLTDAGITITVNDAAFAIGEILEIDCEQGTIKKNGNDDMASLVSGSFLRLQPTVNTIQYTGAACTIRVKYRKVYA